MENNDVLCKVIEVEKEIQRMLGEERKRAFELAENARKKAEEEVADEEQALRKSLAAAMEKARKNAEEKARKTRDSSLDLAAGLAAVSDDRLLAILTKHLPAILPGERHDSKDVQG